MSRAGPRARGYHPRWDKLSRRIRSRPGAHCAMLGIDPKCSGQPDLCDHIMPWQTGASVRERQRLKYAKDNIQILCQGCHNRKTSEDIVKGLTIKAERAARMDYDEDGNPIDLVNAEHWDR